jgi:hypothetical protein
VSANVVNSESKVEKAKDIPGLKTRNISRINRLNRIVKFKTKKRRQCSQDRAPGDQQIGCNETKSEKEENVDVSRTELGKGMQSSVLIQIRGHDHQAKRRCQEVEKQVRRKIIAKTAPKSNVNIIIKVTSSRAHVYTKGRHN